MNMREIIQLVEAADGQHLFHVTLEDNLPSIAREGLTPNTERDPHFDGYNVDGRLFVTVSEISTRFYIQQLSSFGEPVVLRFPRSGVSLAQDEQGNPNDYYTISTIGPGCIEFETADGWKPLSTYLSEGIGSTVRNAAMGALAMGTAAGGYLNTQNTQTPSTAPEKPAQATQAKAAPSPFGTLAARPPKPLEAQEAAASKADFIKTMSNVVKRANADIAHTRKIIVATLHAKNPSPAQREFLEDMFEKYKVKGHDKAELLRRIQIIPVSLVLAQSALESSWGRSRLAQQGNAFFGQKTRSNYHITAKDDGTGDLDGSKGSIRYSKFIDAEDSIATYMRNLNTHPAYADFRAGREAMFKEGKKPTGLDLIPFLTKYSNEGPEYIKKVSTVINKNSLTDLDS